MESKKYFYFVAYLAENVRGEAVGNGELGMDKKISSVADIRAIEKYLSENLGLTKTTLTNYIFLREEDAA
jgi:hypothetical protein